MKPTIVEFKKQKKFNYGRGKFHIKYSSYELSTILHNCGHKTVVIMFNLILKWCLMEGNKAK